MFDTISVSGSLPFSEEMISLGLDKNNLSFQTKDLDCVLDCYVIQNGELFVQKYKTSKWIEGDKNGKSFMDKIGHMERDGPFLQKLYFHGEIFFYEYFYDIQDKWDCWVEFKAVFTDSKLQTIELFKFEKTDNAERKARNLQFMERIKKENARWINKYFFHTSAFCWFRRKIYHKIADGIVSLGQKMRSY